MMEQPTLRGSIDVVRIGKDFLHIEGWVSRWDKKQAEVPISFSFQGGKFSGFGLNVRPDLAKAGIADGVAGFNIFIPNPSGCVPDVFEIDVTDLNGATRTLTAKPECLLPFTPIGAIDRVTAQTISGWIFDPVPLPDGGQPALFFEDEFLCVIRPRLERMELGFDMGDGMKLFGFEVSSELLREAMHSLSVRYRGRNGQLSLVAAGVRLSSCELALSDSNILMHRVTNFYPAIEKAPVSDSLAKRYGI